MAFLWLIYILFFFLKNLGAKISLLPSWLQDINTLKSRILLLFEIHSSLTLRIEKFINGKRLNPIQFFIISEYILAMRSKNLSFLLIRCSPLMPSCSHMVSNNSFPLLHTSTTFPTTSISLFISLWQNGKTVIPKFVTCL